MRPELRSPREQLLTDTTRVAAGLCLRWGHRVVLCLCAGPLSPAVPCLSPALTVMGRRLLFRFSRDLFPGQISRWAPGMFISCLQDVSPCVSCGY